MIHTRSASAHPIGVDTQIPVTPIEGMADNTYARTTLVPSEITVSTTDMAGRLMAR